MMPAGVPSRPCRDESGPTSFDCSATTSSRSRSKERWCPAPSCGIDMSWKNKVVWSEGLFLRPQHFQQQDRYVEGYVEARCRGLRNHSWGFAELTLDRDQLAIGKLVLASAAGVFPDGTPFSIPGDDRSPPALDLPPDTRECRVYLGL